MKKLVSGGCRLGAFPVAAALLLALMVAGCSTAPDTKAETEVLIQRQQAVDYASQGDQNMVARNWSQAEVFYNQSVDANWATDNLPGVVQAHFSLGFLYLGLGYADRADEQYRLAAEAADMLGDPGVQADCRINLAKVLLYRGKAAEALALMEPDGPAVNSGKDQSRLAVWLYQRALALKDLGRLDEAKADLEQALAANRALKRLKEPAACLYLLASIANRQGRPEDALALLGQALESDKQAENSEGIAKDLYAQSVILQKLSGPDGQPRLAEAWNLLRRSFRVSLATNDSAAVERALVQLQELAGKLGLSDQQAAYAGMAAKLKASQSAAAQPAPSASPAAVPSGGAK
jgi:tetratricopeptide (TPR) repeat protein